MAKLKISAAALDEMLFGWSEFPVAVKSIEPGDGCWEFEIEGIGVPDTDNTIAIIHTTQNRVGDRCRTMKFEPLE